MDEFLASQVTEITGIKLNRLQMWMGKKWITPSVGKASGKGTRNLFSREDLYMIALFKKLVETGFSRNLAGEFFKEFRKNTGQPMRMLLLSQEEDCWFEIHQCDDRRWRLVTDTPALSMGLDSKPTPTSRKKFEDVQYMIAINMTKIKRMVDEKITQGE